MMIPYRKVIWAEGVFLGQQHFQQWDQYLQHQQQLLQSHALPFHWGVAAMEVDENALLQDRFCLTRCRALLPDGRWVDFNAAYDDVLTLPLPRQSIETLSVYVALPTRERVSGISGYDIDASRLAAWDGVYQPLFDEYDASRQREVLLAKHRLSLLLDPDSQVGMTVIKLAELEWHTDQQCYRLVKAYSPPVFHLGASKALTSWLTGFIGQLKQQAKRVGEQKEKHRHIHNQFGYGDFIYFNLVKSLTTHLTKLHALQQLPQLHPFYVYEACTLLLGELAGYLDTPWNESPLPAYQHTQLGAVFAVIQRRFEVLLADITPLNTLDIPLQRVQATQFQSGLLNEQCLQAKEFCLAVYHDAMTPELIDKLITQVKVSSPSRLPEIINAFTLGVELIYLSVPSKALLAKRHYHYFLLNKKSPGWEAIINEQMVSFFISHDLTEYRFELISY